MEGSSAGHTAHAKQISFLPLSADLCVGFIPVHLCFCAPRIRLRNEGLSTGQPYLHLPFADVATNRGLRHFHFRHLHADPAPDAMCRMPLLSWRLAVRFQNRIDEVHRRLQLRSLSHRRLSLDRNRTEHRLTHHAPMNPQLLGDPSNRSTAMLILTSDLLE